MADLLIVHDHEGGTRLDGSSKGDGVLEILQPLGWTFRSWSGVHIRGSRDTFASSRHLERAADALRAAGHTVTVEVDNTWRPAAVREAERGERVDARVDRLDERAGQAAGQAAARLNASDRITDGIPFGQPVQPPGHHSRTAHLNALDRAANHMRKSVEEATKATTLAARAGGSAANEAAKHNPRAVMRRVETLETDVRKWRRELADVTAGSEWATTTALRIARHEEEIAYLRAKLAEHADAGTFVAWSRDNIAKGDQVRGGYGDWYTVTRVNQKSVSLNTTSWPKTLPWDEIRGRRRDGVQLDTPNGEPWPVELARNVARWEAHLHRAKGHPHDDATRQHHRYVAWAPRLVHGLDLGAADTEVTAVTAAVTDVVDRRRLAVEYLTVFNRLTAGEPVPAITASLTPAVVPAAWRLPDRPTEARRAGPAGWSVNDTAPLVQPGDLVKGIYDSGSGSTLRRGFCGPVADVSAVNHRREAGDFVTIRLVDGTETTLKTHLWLAVYPAGTGETGQADDA